MFLINVDNVDIMLIQYLFLNNVDSMLIHYNIHDLMLILC